MKRSSRIAKAIPFLISGSADLHGSTLNYIKDGGDFTANSPSGRNIHFGIRETWHVRDHERSQLSRHLPRVRARPFLSLPITVGHPSAWRRSRSLPNIYIFTHDSIGVGEDGPTHEPVRDGRELTGDETARRHPAG